MKIEILCTGDEILSGKTINTNHGHIAQRLLENGYNVVWGTVVGDDANRLSRAFVQASQRADVVIVNGGLGPTVDDLSQEVAAKTAEVDLQLDQHWLNRITTWYTSRGRKMPANNHKQAMLPQGAELIDNPIGTACGFALDINGSRFFFTPGVPIEMRRMLEEQILPRLQTLRGETWTMRLKRFHTFGLGESRVDQMLRGIEEMVPDRSVKLGFQSHYPQLETKLLIQGDNQETLSQTLRPVELEVRKRLGNFVIAEDDDTLEGKIIGKLLDQNDSLSMLETRTSGRVINRLLRVPHSDAVVQHGLIASNMTKIGHLLGHGLSCTGAIDTKWAVSVTRQLREKYNSSLSVTILTRKPDKKQVEASETGVFITITDGTNTHCREATMPGTKEWVNLGTTELALDCLRRFLFGLPVDERIDFEQHTD